MLRNLTILLSILLLLNSCSKSDSDSTNEDMILGKWQRTGTNGTGPGNTIDFTKQNGTYTMSFDCSGSPGPNWPSNAATEYRFKNGKLSYRDYSGNSQGFYTVQNFSWVTEGQKFQLELREVLLYMSATYLVTYDKVP